jgi:hypothetical protein
VRILLFIPLVYLLWRTFRQRRIVITHRETFSLGFLWYGAMPLLLATSEMTVSAPALDGWQAISRIMGPALLQREILWAAGLWLAFIGGCAVVSSRMGPPAKAEAVDFAHIDGWRVVLIGVGLATLLFGCLWAAANPELLFAGYAPEYDDTARGPLQGALLYSAVTAVIAVEYRRQIGRMPMILNVVAIIFLVTLSLSVGTRGMTLIVILMALAAGSRLLGGLARATVFGIGTIVVGGFAAVAVWRIGVGDIGFALLTPALEPLYTYFSAATYLAFNEIPLFAAPLPLLGGLVNLVPYVLWPEKVDFLASFLAGATFFSPLGAMHLFASLWMNFGWIGSLVAMFGAGAAVERLSRANWPPAVASYLVILAVLTTDLWRNPFSMSLVKSVLQGAILVPLAFAVFAAGISKLRMQAKSHDI